MDRVCCFYASREHLMSILLPYINEKLEENQNIVTILEEDIGKETKDLKKIFNFEKENWSKIEEVLKREENLKNSEFKDSIVIIIGNNSFLEQKNKIDEAKIVINCFELMQGLDKIEKILEESDKILTTKGLKEISEMFTQIPKKSYKEITMLK